MDMSAEVGLEPVGGPIAVRTVGEKYEGIAFTFCKVATVCLLAGRFALPAAAGLSAGFYLLAWFKGKRDTRCILKWPLLIAGFWIVIGAISLFAILAPGAWQGILGRVGL